jgi:hypothetical protein
MEIRDLNSVETLDRKAMATTLGAFFIFEISRVQPTDPLQPNDPVLQFSIMKTKHETVKNTLR